MPRYETPQESTPASATAAANFKRLKAGDLSFLPPGLRETPEAIQEFEMLPEPAEKPLLKAERDYEQAREIVENYTSPDGVVALRRFAAGEITFGQFEELIDQNAASILEAMTGGGGGGRKN